MKNKKRILFVVENDYFPRDIRVFNESISLSENYDCFVLAPKQKHEKITETIKQIKCYRYPHFEAKKLLFTSIEYIISSFWLTILIPIISIVKRINFIHVANPPDFIIPLTLWLKLFGIKFIFDAHDLSVETFKGKKISKSLISISVTKILSFFEFTSIYFANIVIATNESVKEYILKRNALKKVFIVRNSNEILYNSIIDINKKSFGQTIHIGYFGVITNDTAAGLSNLFTISEVLIRQKKEFIFSIVGSGPGLQYLKTEVKKRNLDNNFIFHGFVELPQAFEIIKDFDFGVVTWGYLPKNHMHTAMKIMDYMVCGVPVCSLKLKEQMFSTQNIGIHEDSFEKIAFKIIDIHNDKEQYETLRTKTLKHFNEVLCWQIQKEKLLSAYLNIN